MNNDFLDKLKLVKDQLPDLKLRHGGDGVPKKPKVTNTVKMNQTVFGRRMWRSDNYFFLHVYRMQIFFVQIMQ